MPPISSTSTNSNARIEGIIKDTYNAEVHGRTCDLLNAAFVAENDSIDFKTISHRAKKEHAAWRLYKKWDAAKLYEDENYIVINKPPFVLSQARHPEDLGLDLITSFYAYPQNFKVCHRLDVETSGVIVIGKNTNASRHFVSLLIDDELHPTKKYIALMYGEANFDPGKIYKNRIEKKFKGKDPNIIYSVYSRVVDEDFKAKEKQIQNSKTIYSPIARLRIDGKLCTLCEVTIPTGVTHQIRVVSASHGHPLVGEFFYGDSTSTNLPCWKNQPLESLNRNIGRIMLHSRSIDFKDPSENGKIIKVTAPVPDDMREIIYRSPMTVLNDELFEGLNLYSQYSRSA